MDSPFSRPGLRELSATLVAVSAQYTARTLDDDGDDRLGGLPVGYPHLEKACPALANLALSLNLFHKVDIDMPAVADGSKLDIAAAFTALALQMEEVVGGSKEFKEIKPLFGMEGEGSGEAAALKGLRRARQIIDTLEDANESAGLARYFYAAAIEAALLDNAKRRSAREVDLYCEIDGKGLFEGMEKSLRASGQEDMPDEGYLSSIVSSVQSKMVSRGGRLDSRKMFKEIKERVNEDFEIKFDKSLSGRMLSSIDQMMPSLRKAQSDIAGLRGEARQFGIALAATRAGGGLSDLAVEDMLYSAKVFAQDLPWPQAAAVKAEIGDECPNWHEVAKVNNGMESWSAYAAPREIFADQEEKDRFGQYIGQWIGNLAADAEEHFDTLDALEAPDIDDDDDDDGGLLAHALEEKRVSAEDSEGAINFAATVGVAVEAAGKYLSVSLDEAYLDPKMLADISGRSAPDAGGRNDGQGGLDFFDAGILMDYFYNFSRAADEKGELLAGVGYPPDGDLFPEKFIDRLAAMPPGVDRHYAMVTFACALNSAVDEREAMIEDIETSIIVSLLQKTPGINRELSDILADFSEAYSVLCGPDMDMDLLGAEIKDTVGEAVLLPMYCGADEDDEDAVNENFYKTLGAISTFKELPEGGEKEAVVGLAEWYAVKAAEAHVEFIEKAEIDPEVDEWIGMLYEQEAYLEKQREDLSAIAAMLPDERRVFNKYKQFQTLEKKVFPEVELNSKLLYHMGRIGRN